MPMRKRPLQLGLLITLSLLTTLTERGSSVLAGWFTGGMRDKSIPFTPEVAELPLEKTPPELESQKLMAKVPVPLPYSKRSS